MMALLKSDDPDLDELAAPRPSDGCGTGSKPIGEDYLENGCKRAYAFRRKSDARTKSRNGFGVSGRRVGGGALAGFDFTVGVKLFAAFFAVVLAARRARCLVAKSFALASTISAGEPSRAMRWAWQSTAWQYIGAIFQRLSTPSVYG
jgi:hypothetical protein